MIRRTSIRRTTMINAIETQEKLLHQFEKYIEGIKIGIRDKHIQIPYLKDPIDQMINLSNDQFLISNLNELIILNIDENYSKKVLIQRETLSFSYENNRILAGTDSSLLLFDVEGNLITNLSENTKFYSVALSSNATWALSGDDKGVISL